MRKRLEEIREIAVVGAGLMGRGIAQAFAQKDYLVTLYDLNRSILERALSQIRSNLETFVEVGLETEERIEKILSEKNFLERGYPGAGIPKEYGGLGLGAAGACIAVESLNRMPSVGRTFAGSMLGGLRQIIEYGTTEQKKRFLPRIAKGEIGAIVITELFVGTDAAAIETTDKRGGDFYIITRKCHKIKKPLIRGREEGIKDIA